MKVQIENRGGDLFLVATPKAPTLLSPLRLELRQEHSVQVIGELVAAMHAGNGYTATLELTEPAPPY